MLQSGGYLTATDYARRLLALAYPTNRIAEMTGLHASYIRKIVQRDDHRDAAYNGWRNRNPDKVAAYRAKQDAARRRASTRLGIARKPV